MGGFLICMFKSICRLICIFELELKTFRKLKLEINDKRYNVGRRSVCTYLFCHVNHNFRFASLGPPAGRDGRSSKYQGAREVEVRCTTKVSVGSFYFAS